MLWNQLSHAPSTRTMPVGTSLLSFDSNTEAKSSTVWHAELKHRRLRVINLGGVSRLGRSIESGACRRLSPVVLKHRM